MGNKLSKGRAKLSELEKAYRAWYRAYVKLNEVQEEFDATLGLDADEKKTPNGKAILAVAKKRIAVNERLNPVNDEIYQLVYKKDKTAAEEQHLAKLKMSRSKMFAELADLPDLGMTQEEWDGLDDEFKSKRLGRPRISVELQLVRAKDAVSEMKSKIEALEDLEGIEHKTDKQIIKAFEDKANKASGRPSRSNLEKLEAEIRRLQTLIAGFQEEAKTYVPRASGRGRRSLHPLERAERHQEKVDVLKEQVRVLESKMTNMERMDRALKAMRKEYRDVQFKVEQGEKDLKPELDNMEIRIDALEKYREYCKKRDESTVKPRKPYTVSDDLILEYHSMFIVGDDDLKYLPDELVATK